jgi:hypothetical protein
MHKDIRQGEKMMKKLQFLLAVLLVIVAALGAAACGKRDVPPGADGLPPDDGTPASAQVIVYFHLSGGVGVIPAQLVDNGGKATRPAVEPVRDRYVFVDWFTAERGGAAWDFDAAVTAGMTLFARWLVDPPAYTYPAAYSVNAVALDGVLSEGEWDEAVALVLDVNNETFLEYGEFQGADAKSVFTENNFKAIVRVKWDEEYLYIAEDRYNGNIPFWHSETNADGSWRGSSGTLFFFAPDTNDGTDMDTNNFEIFWVDRTKDNGPAAVALRGFVGANQAWDTDNNVNWDFAASIDDDTNHGVFELKIRWAELVPFGGSATPTGGERFRFNPIYKLGYTENRFTQKEGQYAFYNLGVGSKHNDWVTKNTRNPSGGEIPINWAGLVLAAKPL